MKNKNLELSIKDKAKGKIGDKLTDRLLIFAVEILKFISTLPGDSTAKHITTQLFRSSTSAGANYEEARSAESKADFIHKLGIVLKELKETRFWLRLILQAELVDFKKIEPFLRESEELCAIVAQSIITVKKRLKLNS